MKTKYSLFVDNSEIPSFISSDLQSTYLKAQEFNVHRVDISLADLNKALSGNFKKEFKFSGERDVKIISERT